MKKYLFLIAFVLIVFKANSQGFTFTVYGEPQLSWLKPDASNVDNAGARLGFNGGLNFDNFFAENYAFSTGISINKISGKLTYKYDKDFIANDGEYTLDSLQTADYNLQYIDIPLGLKFKTVEIGYTKFFAHLGLNLGINIKASGDLPEYNSINISEEINWYNMGYYFGGGIEYSLGGTTAIVVGLTYRNGFLDVTSDENNKVTSENVSLRLGILF
jgi:hypothetical protein